MAEQQIRGKNVVRHLTPGGHASTVALVEGNAVIRTALPGDESSATWAARAKAGRTVRHDSLAKLIGAKPADPITGEPAFVATEYIDGATLAETAPALSQQESDRVGRSLAAAVKALHDADLPHGRIHPANIRLRDVTPVLLDIAATWGSEPTKDQDVTALVETVRELDLTDGDRAIWNTLATASSIEAVMFALTGGPTPISAPASEDTSVSFTLATPQPETEEDQTSENIAADPTPYVVQEPGPWESLPAGIHIPAEPAPHADDPTPQFVTFDPTPTPEPTFADGDDLDAIDLAVAAPATTEPQHTFMLTAPTSETSTDDTPAREQPPAPASTPAEHTPVNEETTLTLERPDALPTQQAPAAPTFTRPTSDRDEALVRAANTARNARDEALTQVDQLTQRLNDIVGELTTAHADLDSTAVRLERLTIERDDLARNLKSEQEHVRSLTARLDDADHSGDHLAAAETAAAEANQNLQTALADLASTQEALASAREALDIAEARAERAERDASAAHTRADREEAARVEMTRERANAALASAANTGDLRDLNGQIARLRAELERSSAELESARAEAEKNAADAARVRSIDEHVREVEADSAALRRLTADLSARLSQPSGGTDGAAQLRADLAAASAEVSKLHADNAAMSQRIESAETAARTAQAQAAAAQDHARRVQVHAERQIEAAGVHAAKQIEAARASAAQASAAGSVPSASEEAYRQEIDALTQSLETVSSQRDALSQRVSHLEGEASGGAEAGGVADLYAKLSLAENALARARGQIADLTSQLEDAAVARAYLVEARSAQPEPAAVGEPIPLPVNPGPAAFMQARPVQSVVGLPVAGPPVTGPALEPVLPPAPALPPAPVVSQGIGAPMPAPGGDGASPRLLRMLRHEEASGSAAQQPR